MPLYEYYCSTCGEEFEKMMRFSESNKSPECPACHSTETRKKLSLFASKGSSGSGLFSSSSSSSCGPSSGGFT